MKVRIHCYFALTTSLIACQPPSFGAFAPPCEPSIEACPPGSMSDDSTGGGTPFTTGEPGTSTGSIETTADGDSSTGEPAAPILLDAALSPNPVEHSGPVTVAVQAEHAQGVHMLLDDATVELTEQSPGEFVGEIAVYSGLSNGPHAVTLTPWRAELEGEPTTLPYLVTLPEPGTLGFWEAAGVLGEGQGGAVAALPGTDEFIEAGTRFVDGEPRCYLRRRAKTGAWSDSDVLHVLPDEKCAVIDLATEVDGIHLLASREVAGAPRWWLGRMAFWGSEVEHRALGSVGEEAVALASGPGKTAVCGSVELEFDRDAFASIFAEGQVGTLLPSFDYVPEGLQDHIFSERVADCVFNADTLVLGGAVFGDHNPLDIELNEQDRGFLLEVPMSSGTPLWLVPEPESVTQSAVTALVIDDQKRVIAAGYTCDDVCSPTAELRGYEPDGSLFWQTDLPDVLPPRALAWSPAGYLVVASALPQGPWSTAFWLQAWRPSIDSPIWTVSRNDAPSFQSALAVAVGYYGLVLGVGAGAGNVPAVAVVAG